MENNLKFNSAICTSRSQSERLLALGLKRETADMYMTPSWGGSKIIGYYVPNVVTFDDHFDECPNDLPAWSLGRLIEMLPSIIKLKEDLPTFHPCAFLGLTNVSIDYHWSDYDDEERNLVAFYGNGLFTAVVDTIEWLIKKGYFPKEYLI